MDSGNLHGSRLQYLTRRFLVSMGDAQANPTIGTEVAGNGDQLAADPGLR